MAYPLKKTGKQFPVNLIYIYHNIQESHSWVFTLGI